MHINAYPSLNDLKFGISFLCHLEMFNKTTIMALILKFIANIGNFFKDFIALKIKYLLLMWLPQPIYGYNIA